MSDKIDNPPPRLLKLQLDVAISSCGCAVPGCSRITLPGEALTMRELPNSRCYEPLCAVHAAEAVDDMRAKTRIWLHEQAQRREGNHHVLHGLNETLLTTGL